MLSGISIKRSNDIVVSGLRIAPAGAPAIADVSASSRHHVPQRALPRHARRTPAWRCSSIPDDRDITVAQAEFAHCQHGLACILAQGRGLVDRPRALPRRARCRRHPRCGRRRHDQRLRPARRARRHARRQPQRPHPDPRRRTVDDRALALRACAPTARPRCTSTRARGPAGAVHDVHVESSLFTGSNKDMFFADQRARARAVVGPAGDRRRVRQQHDRLGQHRGDRARRRVRERPGRRAAARRRTTSWAARSTRSATWRARSRT